MIKQFSKYALIGLGSNLVLYATYLLLTKLGVEHKLAMTLLYWTGVLQTFIFNRNWTFGHRGAMGRPFVRYVLVYLVGYVVNFLALLIFVDHLGYPHQIVQGIMIAVVTVIVFLLQKYWVFLAHGADKQTA